MGKNGNGNSVRIWTPERLVALLVLSLALALPSGASAAPLHTTPAFSPITGSGIGVTFAHPLSVGVDENNGNIVVPSGQFGGNADNSVFVLNSEGGNPVGIASPFKTTGFTFSDVGMYAVPAVDSSPTSPSKGALYVPIRFGGKVNKYVRNPATEQYELAGELTSVQSLGPVEAVAVDDSGNVWVASPAGNLTEFGAITKFSPTGAQLARIVMSKATKSPDTIAVDSAGDVFIGSGETKAFKFPANGSGEIEASNFVEVPTQPNGQPIGLAIDRPTNTLFVPVDRGQTVAEFDASSLVEKGSFSFPFTNLESERFRPEIAVSHAAGLIYGLHSFEPYNIPVLTLGGPTLPDTGTTEPTEVGATKVTLNGVVNPQGLAVTECKFVVTNPAQTLPCEGALPTDSSPHQVSVQLSGLGVNSGHFYQLITSNANGTNQSVQKNVSTAGIAATKATTAISGSAATLHGIVRPEGAALSECVFEYGATTAYGTTVPCSPAAGSIPADFEAHAVSASLGNLVVGTEYHFRVRAAGGLGAEAGEDLTFKTPGPALGISYVRPLAETSATVNALVNPGGKETTYHFEWGLTAAYGNVTPDASAGSVDAVVPAVECPFIDFNEPCNKYPAASAALTGLTPDTAYHFRVVVSNADGTGTGPDTTFKTFAPAQAFAPCANDAFRAGEPSALLPDCRAYEQATPVDKDGADAGGGKFRIQAAVGGGGITSVTKSGLPGAEGAQEEPISLSLRDPAGRWSTQGFLPPPSFGERAAVRGWTPDLAYSFSDAAFADPHANNTAIAFLSRSSATRQITQITPYTRSAEYAFAGAPADDSKFFFEADGDGVNLTGNAATGKDNLYVYDPVREELSLVGVLPNGTTPPGGSFAGPFDWAGNRLGLGGARVLGKGSSIGYLTQELHAISADGSKAFFTAGGTGQVYVREGLNTEEPETSAVSASQRTVPDPGGTKPAIFMGATPSGSVAFIASCEKLTDDSTAHSTAANSCTNSEQGMDLYAYDTATHELTDLTVAADPGDPRGAEVEGFLGASDDGSYVYFAANADLDGVGPAQAGSCITEAGATGGICNLYLWHAGSISLIDNRLPGGGNLGGPVFAGGDEMQKNSSVSADGKSVVFKTAGHPFTGSGATETRGGYFRYDADTDSLSCVTCGPIGTPPPTLDVGFSSIELGVAAFFHPLGTRFVSASGNRVFFETADNLVPADVNGDGGCPRVGRPALRISICQDVYEWEAPGEGSCSEAASSYSAPNGGCLYLLSSGTSPGPSFFADASASGDDAFIYTEDQLVPGDTDRLYDVYDVRAGGGVAYQNQPPPPVPCETGEACRGSAPAPAASPSAGSATFQGPGDPPIKRCGKGKVAKGGRCVKQKKPKKHRKGKAEKRAGAKRGGSK